MLTHPANNLLSLRDLFVRPLAAFDVTNRYTGQQLDDQKIKGRMYSEIPHQYTLDASGYAIQFTI
jgi:hypothetical protein